MKTIVKARLYRNITAANNVQLPNSTIAHTSDVAINLPSLSIVFQTPVDDNSENEYNRRKA